MPPRRREPAEGRRRWREPREARPRSVSRRRRAWDLPIPAGPCLGQPPKSRSYPGPRRCCAGVPWMTRAMAPAAWAENRPPGAPARGVRGRRRGFCRLGRRQLGHIGAGRVFVGRLALQRCGAGSRAGPRRRGGTLLGRVHAHFRGGRCHHLAVAAIDRTRRGVAGGHNPCIQDCRRIDCRRIKGGRVIVGRGVVGRGRHVVRGDRRVIGPRGFHQPAPEQSPAAEPRFIIRGGQVGRRRQQGRLGDISRGIDSGNRIRGRRHDRAADHIGGRDRQHAARGIPPGGFQVNHVGRSGSAGAENQCQHCPDRQSQANKPHDETPSRCVAGP